MAKSFDDFGSRSSRGCPRCGGPKKEGAVTIRLLEFAEGSSSRFDQRASRQISMCENCTVEVYEELVETLEEEARGGSRAPRTKPAQKASTGRSTRRRRRVA